MCPSSTLPTTWSSAWNSRFGEPVALHEAGLPRDVARQVEPGVARAVDQRVHGVAVRRDGRDADGAVLVGDVGRLLHHPGAGGAGVRDAPVDVGHLERDVGDAVAVRPVVVEQRAVRGDAALDDEPARAALEHERLVVAVAGLRPGVGHQLHAVGRLEVVRGLGGVADHEDDGVPAGHRERVGGGVVLDQADQLGQLLGRELGGALGVGQSREGGSRSVGRHAQGYNPTDDNVRNVCHDDRTSCPARRPVRRRKVRRMTIDGLDARIVEVFAAEPRVGVLECSRRLGRRPRHRAGPAGPDDPGRRHHRLGARARARPRWATPSPRSSPWRSSSTSTSRPPAAPRTTRSPTRSPTSPR